MAEDILANYTNNLFLVVQPGIKYFYLFLYDLPVLQIFTNYFAFMYSIVFHSLPNIFFVVGYNNGRILVNFNFNLLRF